MSLFGFPRQSLSNRIRPEKYPRLNIPYVEGMITDKEQHALACFAQHIWNHGARSDAVMVDAGCYAGASTVALAEGLRHSALTENKRRQRIWCYDLFRTTAGMAANYLKDDGLKPGDSFEPIFRKNVSTYSDYIKVNAGDIRQAAIPSQPIAVLFLDILWSWDCTDFVARNFYPLLDPRRSLLIHQDFVYPYYPWVILSMGMLQNFFAFAYNVQFSSVVFDVKRKLRPSNLEDPRNLPLAAALGIYDGFIDRVDGWGKGSLALGKAMYLASLNLIGDARALIDEVATKFADEPLVTQYLSSIRGYCANAESVGHPVPLDQAVGV